VGQAIRTLSEGIIILNASAVDPSYGATRILHTQEDRGFFLIQSAVWIAAVVVGFVLGVGLGGLCVVAGVLLLGFPAG